MQALIALLVLDFCTISNIHFLVVIHTSIEAVSCKVARKLNPYLHSVQGCECRLLHVSRNAVESTDCVPV